MLVIQNDKANFNFKILVQCMIDNACSVLNNKLIVIQNKNVDCEILHLQKIIGERSEPLSKVFNDQPRDIYIAYYTSKSGIWLVIS